MPPACLSSHWNEVEGTPCFSPLWALLGLSIATLSTVAHYGLRFTLISNVSLDSNAYKVIHHSAFYFGICLSMTLILAALLSSAATVRESRCLTAMVRILTCRDWLGAAVTWGWPPTRPVLGSALPYAQQNACLGKEVLLFHFALLGDIF
uniref:Uncharacterized protein n=1 Tax=Junco hyemalis TaxID=40217 RepID=A0A8C5JDI7_JUNHY